MIGVRELNLGGVPDDQRNWANDHTVYTHGYGVVAAYGTQRSPNGEPVWAQQNLPSTGKLGEFQQEVYYGEAADDVLDRGCARGHDPVELNIPETNDDDDAAAELDVRRQGRCRHRIDVQPDAVRREVLGLLDPAVGPGQLRVEDHLRPRPAADGAEGRAVADGRR